MTIDPRVGVFLSVALAVLAFLGGATSELTDLGLTAAQVKAVVAGDLLLLGVGNAINSVLHMIPSKPGATNQFYLGPKPSQALPAAPTP